MIYLVIYLLIPIITFILAFILVIKVHQGKICKSQLKLLAIAETINYLLIESYYGIFDKQLLIEQTILSHRFLDFALFLTLLTGVTLIGFFSWLKINTHYPDFFKRYQWLSLLCIIVLSMMCYGLYNFMFNFIEPMET